MVRENEKNPSWKGSKAKYKSFHEWLRKNFGSANHCENKKCPGVSKNFQWSLKHGYHHTHDREAYQQLCISCHKHYDMTDQTRKKISASKVGNPAAWLKTKNAGHIKDKIKKWSQTRKRDAMGHFV